MPSTILVTGGTGTLGSLVVPLLREAGHPVRVLSRHARDTDDGVARVAVDLLKAGDEEIEAAVDGAGTVLHLAGGPKGDDLATRNLLRAAQAADVRHFVYISVIGADRVPLAWLRTKREAERAVAGSGLPWTTLRAAQFNELTLKMVAGMARLPVFPAPGGLRLQPVDARDVAARITELTLGSPSGLVADLAGPKVYALAELADGYALARGRRRRPLLPVRIPGSAGRAYRAGDNLSLTGADTGRRTWEDFLAEQVG
ncbi:MULTISPECIES: SDR family oxidoreductase [unclassified Streptomyces]|uniref:SDR family oxidoreductase n=1 Tax=unclassified Streptomyces TaxID=2593676 RepID=UPI0009F0AB1E|nr:NAD(P)H-binding protein [Streptomyces sp. M41(2017)]OQQ20253.1 NmrA family transcriptional regulator [Streptomyces sp. M41(2017)]